MNTSSHPGALVAHTFAYTRSPTQSTASAWNEVVTAMIHVVLLSAALAGSMGSVGGGPAAFISAALESNLALVCCEPIELWRLGGPGRSSASRLEWVKLAGIYDEDMKGTLIDLLHKSVTGDTRHMCVCVCVCHRRTIYTCFPLAMSMSSTLLPFPEPQKFCMSSRKVPVLGLHYVPIYYRRIWKPQLLSPLKLLKCVPYIERPGRTA